MLQPLGADLPQRPLLLQDVVGHPPQVDRQPLAVDDQDPSVERHVSRPWRRVADPDDRHEAERDGMSEQLLPTFSARRVPFVGQHGSAEVRLVGADLEDLDHRLLADGLRPVLLLPFGLALAPPNRTVERRVGGGRKPYIRPSLPCTICVRVRPFDHDLADHVHGGGDVRPQVLLDELEPGVHVLLGREVEQVELVQ